MDKWRFDESRMEFPKVKLPLWWKVAFVAQAIVIMLLVGGAAYVAAHFLAKVW